MKSSISLKQIITLETGKRSTLAGCLLTTKDDRVRWLTLCPHVSGTVQIRDSLDSGNTWGSPEPFVQYLDNKPLGTAVLMQLRSGKWLHIGMNYGGYSPDHDPEKSLNEAYIQTSEDGSSWSDPRTLPQSERYFSDVFALIQTTRGRVVFPFGYLTKDKGKFVCTAAWSDDDGQTWRRSPCSLDAGGEGWESGACEPSVVELPDGRIWMLIRAQTGFIWESFSCDGGETWDPARPSRFISSNSPAVPLRLSNGRIIVVWNNCTHWAYARTNLVMAATDDGEHFFGFREIAHTDFPTPRTDLYWNVTYPSLCEAPDGTILVAFQHGDWTFNQAKLARIDPKWIEETSLADDFNEGLGEWCRLGALGSSPAPTAENGSGRSLLINYQEPGPCGEVRNFPLIVEGEILLNLTVHSPEAYIMLHDSFLGPGKVHEACLRIRFAKEGGVFVAAGSAETKQVEKQQHAPVYSYMAYPIQDEVAYPGKIALGRPLRLRVKCDAGKREAAVFVDNGPQVSAPLGDILGFSYVGIATTEGGRIQLHELETRPTP